MSGFDHTSVGVMQLLNITNPGAGNYFTFPGASGKRRRLWLLTFTLSTDVNVANRQVLLVFRFGAVDVGYMIHPDVQAASLQRIYSLISHYAGLPYSSGSYFIFPFNRNFLFTPQTTIRITAVNLQAGDTFTAINGTVEDFIGD